MRIKKIYVYGSSTFMTGLKLGLDNIDGISVKLFNKSKTDTSELTVENTVLIIEKNLLINLARNGQKGIKQMDINCGDIIELLLKSQGIKMFCLDPDRDDVCILENTGLQIKNIAQLIKKIKEAI